MFTWRKWWLLFGGLWALIAALQVITILAFSPDEQEKALRPALFGVALPAAAYLLGWLWERFISRRRLPPKAK